MSITIGMTVYNGESHLTKAIESLLIQTYRDFTLIIVDDGSIDASWDIITKFQQEDSRIKAFKNKQRMGAIYSWNKAFKLALVQNSHYFAWASDHDLWDCSWLESLYENIHQNDGVVLVYPKTIRIDENGDKVKYDSPEFIANDSNASARINSLLMAGRGYGDMIYGLFRISALERSGVYRRLLVPDTVTIWEICLSGSIIQIDQYLWHRRYVDLFSLERQRRTLFVSPPWYTFLPYWIVNPIIMLFQCNIANQDLKVILIKFLLIIKMSLYYGAAFGLLEFKRRVKYLANKMQSLISYNEYQK